MKAVRLRVLPLLLALVALAPARAELPAPSLPYDALFEATLVPTERLARARLRLGANQVDRMVFKIDPERHMSVRGDGKVTVEGANATWEPPRGGGSLRYDFRIDALRNGSAYDARIAEDWAIFRGSDLFPPARVLAADGAYSRSRLKLRLPKRWTVAVPYERADDGTYVVENPNRHFDRPTAWMALGRLGILRERIAGASVAVAGPFRQELRRQDILAMLRWTLPSLRDVLGELPSRLVVVGAGDPMWRGGLSGPHSLFVHADRPLITPDGTSPLLHEIFHAVTGARSVVDGDWAVEGLAELYSVEMLMRSRTISKRRYRKVLDKIEKKGAGASLLGRGSHGKHTARAVTVLRNLDALLRGRTEGQKTLDDVVAELARKRQAVSTSAFFATAEAVSGLDLASFQRNQVGSILKRERK